MFNKNLILVLGLIMAAGMVNAHFTMVFPGGNMEVTPDDYIAEVGETKTIIIVWGHPFEHILFDMSSVPEVSVRDPEGAVTELTIEETKVEGYKAYKTKFTVDKEGDWIVHVKYEDEESQLIDLTKVVIHCGEEAWFGWDSVLGEEVEIVPYMRPYGIEEGFVFMGKAMADGMPLAGVSVEVERYNSKDAGEAIVAATEERYPNDPPMIFTRVTTSNKEGEFAYTLDEPAIWFVGATKEVEDGYDVRGVMIIPVIEEFPPRVEEGAGVATSALENRLSSLESRISGLSSTQAAGGTSGIVYIALLVGIIAAILALVAIMKK
ncbi:MAG: DUF4198 domain-containing protein [Candidatus Altiarchaeales archaeon]|nr:DUF4198 domain-containing protein [Candidatus Altiarchaeota archaeon]MCG2782097.1 DUF4198 domain-containing protein [Candidatus Altiarchaeales archaeon]MBU4265636.1 DUF4198 domain-containing protein [Candidatus Altiarchaeota archaeon]MBU4341053.1 DUF4198 domain-containing protein [Candidatus Altiarchaeota archaeon]MBU4406037.1 DUF4198 domain-containing protein [Candidatus Altiarchaeota archaeon]